MRNEDTLYGQIADGILTISGSNTRITVSGGNLVVVDGTANAILRRAGCPVRSIVVTRPDGVISFAAIAWLHGAGVSLTQLDWRGEILLTTAPLAPDFPAIRRAQALACDRPTGIAIAAELVQAKIAGQAAMLGTMGRREAAGILDMISTSPDLLALDCDRVIRGSNPLPGLDKIMSLEATAAAGYWRCWENVSVGFARKDVVPEHWRTFGTRQSPVTNSPRAAATPGNAMLNYAYAVAAAEMSTALTGAGLDPGVGVFHRDKQQRPSLAYDALESVRPGVDRWLWNTLTTCRFNKRDFFEEPNGAIRITRPLSSHLAMTRSLWRSDCRRVAGWLARMYGQDVGPCGYRDHKAISLHTLSRVNLPRLSTCWECGAILVGRRARFCNSDCSAGYYKATDNRAAALIAGYSKWKSDPKRVAQSAQRMMAARRPYLELRKNWILGSGITAKQRRQAREWYRRVLMPMVIHMSDEDLQSVHPFSGGFRRSLRGIGAYEHNQGIPHVMHFAGLARVAGIEPPDELKECLSYRVKACTRPDRVEKEIAA